MSRRTAARRSLSTSASMYSSYSGLSSSVIVGMVSPPVAPPLILLVQPGVLRNQCIQPRIAAQGDLHAPERPDCLPRHGPRLVALGEISLDRADVFLLAVK